MNNDKIILESISWLMSNAEAKTYSEGEKREKLLGRINDVVNPEEQPTIAERTHDALSQKNAGSKS